jgi:tetratricopeptide (TPR) repeat protein
LLEKWSWQTGAQPVYQPDDEIDDSPRPRSPVPYIVGAGLVFAGAILTIMVAFGDAKKPAKKSGAAAAGSSADPHSVNAPHDAAPADLANPGIAPPPTTPDRSDAATGSAPVDAMAADAATADAAAPPPDSKPQPTQEKPVPSELPAKRSEKSEAKIEAKPDAKVDPKPAAKPTARSAKADAAAKSSAEQAYRQGLQLFMRGDTSGAARALRTSLGASPNYAPAWRALGLVFEKTGDTDQARTAFKRYLQLAPSANDAQQIRNRLEKLGS